MINYTKKDQDFHGIFKLVSGEEVLAKAVITEDGGECLVFMQDPVVIHTITNPISDNKVMRGMGFTKWMPMSDEDFFIVRDRDIVTMGLLSFYTFLNTALLPLVVNIDFRYNPLLRYIIPSGGQYSQMN